MDNQYYIRVLSDFKRNEFLKDKTIIVFGLGIIGKKIVEFALNKKYKIVEIWDNYSNISEYKDIKVCRPHSNFDNSIPIVIAVYNEDLNYEISEKIKLLGYKHIFNYCELYIGEKFTYDEYRYYIDEIYRYKIKKLYPLYDLLKLSHVEMPITEKCSLKCKECADLIQYFKNPVELDVEESLQDIDAFLSSIYCLDEFTLLGGEPLTCKNLYRYVNALKRYKNVGFIYVVTNGTIIPKGENLECLKHDRVCVRISNYGSTSRKLKELEDLFRKEKILYKIINADWWYVSGEIKKRNRTDAENREILSLCSSKVCVTIKNNKVFRCPVIANSWALKAMPKDVIEYVNIDKNDIQKTRENLIKYLSKDILLGCDYCAGRSSCGEKTNVAEQISKPLEYDIYN